jgi:negative regulator of flagellin synthesis FlgM
MKIDNVPHPTTPPRVDHGKGNGRVANVAPQGEANARSATHLGRITGNTGHDIDHARVAELRQAIADGRLSVNTDRIAERLLDGVRDMLGGMQ